MQSAATLPGAAEIVDGLRARTMDMILAELTGNRAPRPALRTDAGEAKAPALTPGRGPGGRLATGWLSSGRAR